MDPSEMKDELDSILKASSTWETQGVLIDVYFLNTTGGRKKYRRQPIFACICVLDATAMCDNTANLYVL
jgi:hypothetical protein